MSVLELRTADIEEIKKELQEKVAQAPEFFRSNPLVLSFESLNDDESVDLANLVTFSRSLGFLPSGVKGANLELQAQALSLSLPVFPKGHGSKNGSKDSFNNSRQNSEVATEERAIDHDATESAAGVKSPEPTSAAKIISVPIRSGQQIYSDGDLIVTTSVSAGAEVLARGNIHIYGALRGRALAGVHGDEQARVFCQSQEAELVSVAGHFMIDENLRGAYWKEATQAYFNGEELIVEKLAL